MSYCQSCADLQRELEQERAKFAKLDEYARCLLEEKDREAHYRMQFSGELEQERARSAALDELVGEYEAQWGDEYLAKKWELKEQRAALKKPDGEAAK